MEPQDIPSTETQAHYEAFLESVRDFGALWGAGGAQGWVLLEDAQGRRLLPVWSHETDCRDWVRERRGEETPRKVTLEDFLDRWLPGLERDGVRLAIAPAPEEGLLTCAAADLAADLRGEDDGEDAAG